MCKVWFMRNSIDWSEFVKNESGKESVDRLLLLASFPFATALAIKIGTTEALGVYLAAYGALAANNKWANRHATPTTENTLETDSHSAGSDKPANNGISKGKSRVRG